MTQAAEIAVLDKDAILECADELADVLLDCIAGGASVSFMAGMPKAEAVAFFRNAAAAAGKGGLVLFAARLQGRIVGTVQLGLDMPPNQPHRGDIRKLLVHRSARGRGIGAALMARAEAEAKSRGRTLLVLDTADDSAARLYERGGWVRAGIIPGYALWPGGGLCDTVIFWKQL